MILEQCHKRVQVMIINSLCKSILRVYTIGNFGWRKILQTVIFSNRMGYKYLLHRFWWITLQKKCAYAIHKNRYRRILYHIWMCIISFKQIRSYDILHIKCWILPWSKQLPMFCKSSKEQVISVVSVKVKDGFDHFLV